MATTAGLIAYAGERGTTVADNAATAAGLVRASDYITYHYVRRFVVDVFVEEADLDAAIYEAALLEIAAPGFFNKTFTPAEQKVLTQVGDIKWEMRGDASGSEAATPRSTRIDAILERYAVYPAGGLVV